MMRVATIPCICTSIACTCIAARLLVDKLREERAIILADQETRQLAFEPVGEAARELGIMASLQTLEQKRPEQHLAAGIDGTLLLRKPGLKRFFLASSCAMRSAIDRRAMIKLSSRYAGRTRPRLHGASGYGSGLPCQAEQTAVGQVAVGNSYREAEIRRIEDSQGRTYELGPTRIAENAA